MAEQIYVGRRKTSVARVIVKPGNGQFTVNGKTLEAYFPVKIHQDDILGPFRVTDNEGAFDVRVRVRGGGATGQSQAVRLGIARALSAMSDENHPKLKAEGYMTRDPRMVERKKYGQPKARKKFQFSKR